MGPCFLLAPLRGLALCSSMTLSAKSLATYCSISQTRQQGRVDKRQRRTQSEDALEDCPCHFSDFLYYLRLFLFKSLNFVAQENRRFARDADALPYPCDSCRPRARSADRRSRAANLRRFNIRAARGG